MAFLVLDKFEPKDPTALPKILRKSLIDWEGTEPGKVGIGECTTEGATKVVSITSFSIEAGVQVRIHFTKSVPASSTININDSGGKPIYWKASAIGDNVIVEGDYANFIYYDNKYLLISVDRCGVFKVRTSTDYDNTDDTSLCTPKGAFQGARFLIASENSTDYNPGSTMEKSFAPSFYASRQLIGEKIWTGTQAEYDALETKSTTTLYFIKES